MKMLLGNVANALLRRPLVTMTMAALLAHAALMLAPARRELPSVLHDAVQRDAEIRREWLASTGHLPTAREFALLQREKENDAVLFAEAVRRDLHRADPLASRRLRLDAQFLGIDAATCGCDVLEEMIALGLHERDLVVRRRLIQRMRETLIADASQPISTASLQRYYQWWSQHRWQSQRISFQQQWQGVGVDPLLAGGDSFNALTPQQIAARFGIAFADAIRRLPLNQWIDDIPGAHGRYRVRVIARDVELAPPIEQIRDQLTGDLRERRQQRYLQAALAGLRPLYGLAP